MKNTILALVALLGLLASNCKNNPSTEAGTAETASDTVSGAGTAKAPSAEQGNGGLMADMKEMMDRVHALEKRGIADYDLAAELREHHKGAIAMSETQLNYGTDAQLKRMAQKIKDAQQKEVSQIGTMLDEYDDNAKDYDPMDTDSGLGKAMMDNMQAMMKLPETDGTSVDRSFAAMMIKHHQDGIRMGKTIQQYAKDAKFKQMAQKMISDQQKEIEQLQGWLAGND